MLCIVLVWTTRCSGYTLFLNIDLEHGYRPNPQNYESGIFDFGQKQRMNLLPYLRITYDYTHLLTYKHSLK